MQKLRKRLLGFIGYGASSGLAVGLVLPMLVGKLGIGKLELVIMFMTFGIMCGVVVAWFSE